MPERKLFSGVPSRTHARAVVDDFFSDSDSDTDSDTDSDIIIKGASSCIGATVRDSR